MKECRLGVFPSPLEGEGGARRDAVRGRGGSVLLERARQMRTNPTDAERRLWAILRNKRLAAHKFKRQQVIGNFIVDFVNFEHRLIVEADGSQHIGNEQDNHRTAWLERQGFRVLRFWNDAILARTDQVADAIWCALIDRASALSPTPLPQGGKGLLNGAIRV